MSARVETIPIHGQVWRDKKTGDRWKLATVPRNGMATLKSMSRADLVMDVEWDKFTRSCELDENPDGTPVGKTEEPAPAFAPGDVVHLRSGGCPMTVVAAGDMHVTCTWHDMQGTPQLASIPLVCLKPAPAFEDTP